MIRVQSNFKKQFSKWLAAFGCLGLFIYPIIIAPIIDPTKYQKVQKITREGIDPEKTQPGNMRIWSDPFDRRKPKVNEQ